MSHTLAACSNSWNPPDKRGVAEWASEYVSVPGSARSLRFDPAASPWLREGLQYFGDNRVREQLFVLPTGAGKTTIFDVTIPHAIKENPGSILLAMQTDKDADEHMEDRLLPTLKGCTPLAPIFAALDRHAIKKSVIVFPHMSLYSGGSNKTNFQRKSVRYVFLDEAWLIKHGLIEEARARTHNRWNRRIVIVSQGGEMHAMHNRDRVDTELYASWKQTDMREYSMVCPECREVHPWKWSALKYEDATTPDGEIDQSAILESATYECPGRCKTQFPDRIDVRRQLSSESVYQPTNDNALPHHHGWHAPAMALFHERWGDLALGWKKASVAAAKGDFEPRKIFITKRLAEFWRDAEASPDLVLCASGYRESDYANGETWEGEFRRFLTIDRQRDHYWVVARAWAPDGSSRMLRAAKILTVETIRELQIRLRIRDDLTFQDAQHDTGDVYDDCARFGWIALHGSGQKSFPHLANKKTVKKFFSTIETAAAPHGGRARYIFWSNTGVKDELTKLRGGRGPSWQAPDDVSKDYREQIISEMKRDHVSSKTKEVTQIYVRIGGRPNHLWDCEAMQTAAAMMTGVLGSNVVDTGEKEDESQS